MKPLVWTLGFHFARLTGPFVGFVIVGGAYGDVKDFLLVFVLSCFNVCSLLTSLSL